MKTVNIINDVPIEHLARFVSWLTEDAGYYKYMQDEAGYEGMQVVQRSAERLGYDLRSAMLEGGMNIPKPHTVALDNYLNTSQGQVDACEAATPKKLNLGGMIFVLTLIVAIYVILLVIL